MSKPITVLDFQKNFQESLNRENKAFNKLSKQAKRIAIAQDVLEQIRLGRYKAQTGTYVEADTTFEADDQGFCNVENIQANYALRNDLIECTVCAKGALFMSHVNKTNHCTVDDLRNYDESAAIVDHLEDIFDPDQLHLIEAAFESDEDFVDRHNTEIEDEERDSAVDFGHRYTDDEKRLIAICKNIIRNKGIFKP